MKENRLTNIKIVGVCISLFIVNITRCDWQTSYTPNSLSSGWVVQITNKTQNQQNIHAYFYACRDDHGYIDPGQTLYAWAGACHLKRIDIDNGVSFIGPFKGTGFHYSLFEIAKGNDGITRILHTGTRPY